MVAGIYFLRDLLLFVFTKLLLGVRSRTALALRSVVASARCCRRSSMRSPSSPSSMTVGARLLRGVSPLRFRQALRRGARRGHDEAVQELHRADLDAVPRVPARPDDARGGRHRARRRHDAGRRAAEPADRRSTAGWTFVRVLRRAMAPVSMPVLVAGSRPACSSRGCGGSVTARSLPVSVRQVLAEYDREQTRRRTSREVAVLIVQALAALILVVALGLHVAEVGIIGLRGDRARDRVHRSDRRAAPRQGVRSGAAVHRAARGVLRDRRDPARPALFEPVISAVLAAARGRRRPRCSIWPTRALSAISDNVFVATIYITEVKAALLEGTITREQFERAGGRHQYRHEHSEHRDAERAGRVPVPADLGAGAADQTFVRAHDVDGAALHRDADADWPLGRCIPAVGAGTQWT